MDKKINVNEQLKLLLARQDILAYIVMALIILFVSTKFYSFQTQKVERAKEAQSEENKKVDLLGGLVKIEQEAGPYQQFFSRREQVDIINEISGIARQEEVKVSSIQPLEIAKEKAFTREGFSISLEAKYHSIGRFVNRLERSGSFFRIEKLSLAQQSRWSGKPDKQPEERVITATMQLTMLYVE
ncbi:MAG: type 4a pilus biogenesis protein PilO [Candidatus Omnitrophica bacterium]|nr:type 4a pilus biogenesis protein PilO [Candidatus Omnitrophota bacterium]